MKKIIENIRSKPDHHKDRIIWVCAAIVAGILLIAWMIVGNGRKINNDQNFFQTFNEGVQEGRDAVPQELITE